MSRELSCKEAEALRLDQSAGVELEAAAVEALKQHLEGCEACRAFVAQVDGVEAELRAGYREAPEFQPDSPGGAAAAERFLAGLAALQGDGSQPVSEQAARDAERFAKIFAERPADDAEPAAEAGPGPGTAPAHGGLPDDGADPARDADPSPEPIPFERAQRPDPATPYLRYTPWAVALVSAAALLLVLLLGQGEEPAPDEFIPIAGPTYQQLLEELEAKNQEAESKDQEIQEKDQEIERLRRELDRLRRELEQYRK